MLTFLCLKKPVRHEDIRTGREALTKKGKPMLSAWLNREGHYVTMQNMLQQLNF